jgi:predicted alpha/beta hydrolase family esterase
MRLWRSALTIRYGDQISVLCSECNQENTDSDINTLGQRLSHEVQRWIEEETKNIQFKLSFIGHSLGGIIIRTALPLLKRYQQNMNTFMTLASPHLGYLASQSTLVDTGFWMIRKWRKCRSLEQLS